MNWAEQVQTTPSRIAPPNRLTNVKLSERAFPEAPKGSLNPFMGQIAQWPAGQGEADVRVGVEPTTRGRMNE